MRQKGMLVVVVFVGTALCQERRLPTTDPNVQRTPLRQLVSINSAAVQYWSWLKRVATSLKQLDPGPGNVSDATAADLIPSKLAAGIDDGYRFTLTGNKAEWRIEAAPLNGVKDGLRITYTVESRISRPR
jgi:hypothetical protein